MQAHDSKKIEKLVKATFRGYRLEFAKRRTDFALASALKKHSSTTPPLSNDSNDSHLSFLSRMPGSIYTLKKLKLDFSKLPAVGAAPSR